MSPEEATLIALLRLEAERERKRQKSIERALLLITALVTLPTALIVAVLAFSQLNCSAGFRTLNHVRVTGHRDFAKINVAGHRRDG